MSPDLPVAPPASDELTEAFEALMQRLSGFTDVGAEAVDGYLTAVACSPQPWPTLDWLPGLFGDAFDRCFADPDDAARARDTLERWLARVAQSFTPADVGDDPERIWLQPYLVEWDEAARSEARAEGATDEALHLMHTGALWAEGFLSGIEAQLQSFAVPMRADQDQAMAEMLMHLKALHPQDDEAFRAHCARFYPARRPARDLLLDVALMAVQDLRMLLLDIALTPAPRRSEPKVGRNDPCPCGSGRKFKKCCAALARPG